MKEILISAIMSLGVLCASAAEKTDFPTIHQLPSGTVLSRLSDNGQWGISQKGGETEQGELYSNGGEIWNIKTMTSTSVAMPKSGIASINDITDNGNIVVGSCDGLPAIYNVSTGQWTLLPLPSGATRGSLLAVTPDGSRAVGAAHVSDEWEATPVAYDLTTLKLLTLKNVPTVDMNHDIAEINRFCSISADGRYILGRLSEQLLLPVSMCAYVYDTMTDHVDYIGFTPNSSRPWTPDYKGLYFIDHVEMSPSGNYVTGMAYIVHDVDGQNFTNEYYTAFKYDVADGTFEIYDGPYDSDIAGFGITDSGTVLASVPAVNPYASMAVRKGKYYYRLDEIYPDFYSRTSLANTGKPIANSSDGRVVAMLTSPTESYVMTVSDDWENLCEGVNLLADFTVSPTPGASISSLSEVSLRFNRNIDLAGAARRVTLNDENGNVVATAVGATVKDATLTVTFSETKLEENKRYSVSIREGFVTMTGDALVASDEINIGYVGRADLPVKPTSVSPASGSSFARLDPTSSYVTLVFDSEVKLADGVYGNLMRETESLPFASLVLASVNDSTIVAYPTSRQYLYDGTDYRVIIPAGAVTDLSGSGPNEEITITYSGNYVREVSSDDRIIFSDDFSDYANFMFFDGDRLSPAEIPAGWGFTAETPWLMIRESEESVKMALAAHSMFSTPGRADDWAVTPQLFIPDARCYLRFEAQSYLHSKTDSLLVYAYVNDNGYSTLTSSIVDDIRANGDIVFAEQLTPGQFEEKLEGDWQTFTVDLARYAGKSIYLAFVNQNENQSAVILNHVEVIHDMQYLTTVTTPDAVVKADDLTIEGTITPAGDIYEIKSVDMALRSGQKVISTLSASNLELKQGKPFSFSFPVKLPLKHGEINRYAIDLVINETDSATYNFSVKNLEFATERKIVIEEYSGRSCANCPLGFLAMENLEHSFPGAIIPVVIRTFQSDPLGSGLEAYSEFIGLDKIGAPSGLINRSFAGFPMVSVGEDYRFSGVGAGENGEDDPVVWFDAVSEMMLTAPDGEVDFTATLDPTTQSLTVSGSTRFALNGSLNVSLLGILLENDRATKQSNNLYAMTDSDLGPWGAGGLYGKSRVDITLDHVARQVYGTTFNGTPGLVPAVQTAGTDYQFSMTVPMPDNIENTNNLEFVIMMINSDTDRTINSQRVAVEVDSSIAEIAGSTDAPVSYFDLLGRPVSSPRRGQLLIKRVGNKTSKIIF